MITNLPINVNMSLFVERPCYENFALLKNDIITGSYIVVKYMTGDVIACMQAA